MKTFFLLSTKLIEEDSWISATAPIKILIMIIKYYIISSDETSLDSASGGGPGSSGG